MSLMTIILIVVVFDRNKYDITFYDNGQMEFFISLKKDGKLINIRGWGEDGYELEIEKPVSK